MYITGSQEERDWAEDHRHSAVHQTRDPHHHRVQGSGLCVRQGHLGTYHLRIRWSGDDGNGTDFFLCIQGCKGNLGDYFTLINPNWLSIHRDLNWGQGFSPPPPSFCEHKKSHMHLELQLYTPSKTCFVASSLHPFSIQSAFDTHSITKVFENMLHNVWSVVSGQTLPRRSLRDSGTECGLELHRF